MLSIKGTQSEAKNNCSAIDSTLITIGSEKEEKFLSTLLAKYRGIAGNVWIGLEYVGNNFTWIDRNDMTYQNWDENAVKDGINKCVDMVTYESDFGEWIDDNCNKKYLIACQKKQDTKTVLSQQVKNLTNVIEKQQNELKSHQSLMEKQQNQINNQKLQLTNQSTLIGKQIVQLDSVQKTHQDQLNNQQKEISSLIPLGFLYTQLPNQSSPDVLWPNMKWTEVTQQYAGLFFRAEGSGSLPFGQTQPSNQSWISDIWTWSQTADNENGRYPFNIGLKEGEWTEFFPGAELDGYPMFYGLRFYTTSAEVRPKNTAIKIWKRVK